MKKIILYIVMIPLMLMGNVLKGQGNATWTLGFTHANGTNDVEANPVSAVVPGTNDVVIAYRSNPGHLRLSRVDLNSEKLKWPSDRDVTINTTYNVYPTAILCHENSIYVAAITSSNWTPSGAVGNSYIMRFDLSTGNLLSSSQLANNGNKVPHIRNIHYHTTSSQTELICTGFTSNLTLGNHKDKYIVKLNPTSLSGIDVFHLTESTFLNDVIYSSLINANGNLVAVGYELGNSFIIEINPANGAVIRYKTYQVSNDHTGGDKIIERIVNGSSEYFVANHRLVNGTTDIIISKINSTFSTINSYSIQDPSALNQNERCSDLFINSNSSELIICGKIGTDDFIRSYNMNSHTITNNWNYRTDRGIDRFARLSDNLICGVADIQKSGNTNIDLLVHRITNLVTTGNNDRACPSDTTNLTASQTSNDNETGKTLYRIDNNNVQIETLQNNAIDNELENICGGTIQTELCTGKIKVSRTNCNDYTFAVSAPNGNITSIVWTLNGKLLGETSNVSATLTGITNTICVKYFVKGKIDKAISSCCEKCTTIVSANLTSNDIVNLQKCNFGEDCVPYLLDVNEKFQNTSWASYSLGGGNRILASANLKICLPVGEHEINYYDEFGCLLHTRRIIVNDGGPIDHTNCDLTFYTCNADKNDYLPILNESSTSECPECYDANSKNISIGIPQFIGRIYHDKYGNIINSYGEKYERKIKNYETCKECTFSYTIFSENCNFAMPEIEIIRDPGTNLITGYRWVFPNGSIPTNIVSCLSNGTLHHDAFSIDMELTMEHGLPNQDNIILKICRKVCPDSSLQLADECCREICYRIIRYNGQIYNIIPCEDYIEGGNNNTPPSQQETNTTFLAAESLQIIPNPTTSVFRIVPENAGEAAVEYKSVSIFDAAGKEVMQKTNISSATWIDITSLNPGIYMVKTTYKEKEVVLRVMRQDD